MVGNKEMKSDFFYSVEIVPIALRQFPKAIFLLNNYVCTVLIYILLEAFLFFILITAASNTVEQLLTENMNFMKILALAKVLFQTIHLIN